jgi:hypothetical protein
VGAEEVISKNGRYGLSTCGGLRVPPPGPGRAMLFERRFDALPASGRRSESETRTVTRAKISQKQQWGFKRKKRDNPTCNSLDLK